MTRDGRQDTGSVTVELAVLVPVIVLIGLLVVAAGRIHAAQQAVEHAAAVAARDASLARSPISAAAAAREGARGVLVQRGLTCSPVVDVDTSGFSTRPGALGVARVSVACNVPLADLTVPGLPGSTTVTSAFASPVDPFRGRDQ